MTAPKVVFEASMSRWEVQSRQLDFCGGKWERKRNFDKLGEAIKFAQRETDSEDYSPYDYRVVDREKSSIVFVASMSRWEVQFFDEFNLTWNRVVNFANLDEAKEFIQNDLDRGGDADSYRYRIIDLEANGKVGNPTVKFHPVLSRWQVEMRPIDGGVREEAWSRIANYNDFEAARELAQSGIDSACTASVFRVVDLLED